MVVEKEGYVSMDELLKEAFGKRIQDELAEIPKDEVIDQMFPVSVQFQQRMKKLICKEEGRRRRRAMLKGIKRAAAVLLMLFVMSGGLLLVNEDARAAVQSIVLRLFEDYDSLTFSPQNELVDATKLYPAYLPEGYGEWVLEEIGPIRKFYCYDIKNNKTTISISNFSIITFMDNEYSEPEVVSINGNVGDLYLSKNEKQKNFLMYTMNNGNLYVVISGKIDRNALIRVAEGVIAVK